MTINKENDDRILFDADRHSAGDNAQDEGVIGLKPTEVDKSAYSHDVILQHPTYPAPELPGIDDDDNKTSGGFHGAVTGSSKTAGDAHDVTSSYAADGTTDVDISCEAVDDGDSSNKSDPTSAAANDDHSTCTDEAINEDQWHSQHNEPSDIVAPPATFGESSTDDTTAVTSVRDDLDASSDIQVADSGSSVRRTRAGGDDAELTLTPNPYQSFSVV